MLEKTEGAMKNGQSRDTDNIEHTLSTQDTGPRQSKHKTEVKWILEMSRQCILFILFLTPPQQVS